MSLSEDVVSFPRRLGEHARERPSNVAVRLIGSTATTPITWAELDADSNRAARYLATLGVEEGSWVAVSLTNCREHFLASMATWKLGAALLPLNSQSTAAELGQILELVHPAVFVGDNAAGGYRTATREQFEHKVKGFHDSPLPDIVSCPGKAIASGGSTGRPKIIVDPTPWAQVPGGFGQQVGFVPNKRQLVSGPLYHNGPFGWSHLGLFDGCELTLLTRFDARLWLDAVEQHRIEFAWVVPTMMKRIADHPHFKYADLSSIEVLLHGGGPCAPWLKELWIDRIGARRVYESYGSTEAIGASVIRGDEWLEHHGSVGKPVDATVQIRDDVGQELPAGTVGEIYMAPHADHPTFEYIGASIPRSDDGFMSVGDLGWVDEDGYLYISDRRADMIVSGGANVYPVEVEGVLLKHANVFDAAVIGITDGEWGQRVHALVVLRDDEVQTTEQELREHSLRELSPYKVPKTIEFLDALPRAESGKLRRSHLRAEREESPPTTELDSEPLQP